ncbi:Methyltransferase domain of unknown function DUF2260 [Penicillium expansum]|nr:Methyltransferase domain of unknown function DUF2260 [Penicillium expansum]
MPVLYSLEPISRVSYLNLATPSEKHFQKVYWGDHYARLAGIKRKVDKDGLFIAKYGVGSEDWDEEGTCRKPVDPFSRAWAVLAGVLM